MVRAVAQQILPIDVSNLKKLVRDEIIVVKGAGKLIVVVLHSNDNVIILLFNFS